MSKFRVNKPLTHTGHEQDIRIQAFAKGAEEHVIEDTKLNPKDKPTKSFTIPLNEYELLMLQKLSAIKDRSQRYISRQLLVKALENELNLNMV